MAEPKSRKRLAVTLVGELCSHVKSYAEDRGLSVHAAARELVGRGLKRTHAVQKYAQAKREQPEAKS